jgi:hypothetical protein
MQLECASVEIVEASGLSGAIGAHAAQGNAFNILFMATFFGSLAYVMIHFA